MSRILTLPRYGVDSMCVFIIAGNEKGIGLDEWNMIDLSDSRKLAEMA